MHWERDKAVAWPWEVPRSQVFNDTRFSDIFQIAMMRTRTRATEYEDGNFQCFRCMLPQNPGSPNILITRIDAAWAATLAAGMATVTVYVTRRKAGKSRRQ